MQKKVAHDFRYDPRILPGTSADFWQSHRIASCLICIDQMKLIIMCVFLNYFHKLSSRFVTCPAYYANKLMSRFPNRQRALPLPYWPKALFQTTICSADNKTSTLLSVPLHIFILNFQDRKFSLFRKGIDVSESLQTSPACPYDKSSMNTKIIIKRKWNGTYR